MEQQQGFIDYIEQSIVNNWDLNALTDYKGVTLQYKDVARKIAKFHIVLESAGIQPGDKIAVCGRIGQLPFWQQLLMELLSFPFSMNSKPTIYITLLITPKQNFYSLAIRHGKT